MDAPKTRFFDKMPESPLKEAVSLIYQAAMEIRVRYQAEPEKFKKWAEWDKQAEKVLMEYVFPPH